MNSQIYVITQRMSLTGRYVVANFGFFVYKETAEQFAQMKNVNNQSDVYTVIPLEQNLSLINN